MSRAELTIGRDYCRGCKGQSVQRYAGWATSDGHENSARPRAFYRQCETCGTTRLVLGNVNDAEGLCRTVLRGWLERGGTGARMDGRPSGDGSLDAEDALGFLTAEVWKLYLVWMPTLSGGSFLAYASGLLPKRLAVWSREASGEPETRAKGRRFPKAHAASVSVSLDGLTTGDANADESGERGARSNGASFFKDGRSCDSFGSLAADDEATDSFDVLRVLAAGGGGGARGDGSPSRAAPVRAAGTRREDRS